VRALLRSKNIDVRSNCGYNIVNGSDRRSVEVPDHARYNQNDGRLRSVGETIIGSGYAGRPVRKDLFMTPMRTQSVPSVSQSEMIRKKGEADYGIAKEEGYQ